ncbi:MAG: type 4a pilus biogenesis protein PilO [Candidatus Riflebacteria bacterium]|nr:type 4a pilus biogenesis protein PilO [Candidatus Riflebacteria bacterium]
MNNFAAYFVIVLLAAAGAAGAFYMYYYKPIAIDDREKIQGEINTLKAKQAEISNLEAEVQEYKNKIAAKQTEKEKLAMESNQANTAVPKLLDSTESIAHKFNIKFQDIRISPLVRAEQWSELPVEIGILGTFQDLSQFLYVMERRKIVNLAAGSINIAVSAEVDPKSKSPFLTVTLNAKIYILGGGA